MTSDTVPPRSSSPRRGPPLDLVLHALQDALTGLVKQSAEKSPALISIAEMNASTLVCALTRAINPGALASTWDLDFEADIAGAHLARRLANPGGTNLDLRPTSNAEGRTLETAVARRLADTACSLAITGDKEDTGHASALWEAAATLTGLLPPYTGDTLRAAADLFAAIHGAAPVQPNPPPSPRPIVAPMPNPLPTTPRILQSADEAPCGSLWETLAGRHTGRLVLRNCNGDGHNIPRNPTELKEGWCWYNASEEGDFPARLIAEGLTEAECRHLSGLSAQEAIAWCERRSSAGALYSDNEAGEAHIVVVEQAEPLVDAAEWVELRHTLAAKDGETTLDAAKFVTADWCRMKRNLVAAEELVQTIRAALAVPGADDIVAHARKMKATADDHAKARTQAIAALPMVREETTFPLADLVFEIIAERNEHKAIADRRLQALHQADERDSMVREHLGAEEAESTVEAAKRCAKARDSAVRDLQSANLGAANVKAATDRLLAQSYAERDAANGQRDIEVARASAAIKERNAMFMERDAAIAEAAHVRKTSEDYVFDALKGQREAKDELAAAIAVSEAVIKERDAAREEVKALRRAAANSINIAIKPGDGLWRGLMSGPMRDGRWTLETYDGLLRMRWPNGIVEALVEPRHEDNR